MSQLGWYLPQVLSSFIASSHTFIWIPIELQCSEGIRSKSLLDSSRFSLEPILDPPGDDESNFARFLRLLKEKETDSPAHPDKQPDSLFVDEAAWFVGFFFYRFSWKRFDCTEEVLLGRDSRVGSGVYRRLCMWNRICLFWVTSTAPQIQFKQRADNFL